MTTPDTTAEKRREALLFKLLKTPPQPRPKRERGKKSLLGLAPRAPAQKSLSFLLGRDWLHEVVDREAACPWHRLAIRRHAPRPTLRGCCA